MRIRIDDNIMEVVDVNVFDDEPNTIFFTLTSRIGIFAVEYPDIIRVQKTLDQIFREGYLLIEDSPISRIHFIKLDEDDCENCDLCEE